MPPHPMPMSTDAPSAPTPACYADTADFLTAPIVAHDRIAEGMHRIRLDCPGIAARALPGQFAMLRIPDRTDPLLARPLAVYDTFGDPRRHVDFVYAVHGKFTTALRDIAPGGEMIVWGPLGNGFSIPPVDHLVLVAGGIGQTALLALGRERLGLAAYGPPSRTVPQAKQVTLCWGARHAGLFGAVDDFRRAGIDVHLATLDGSTGRRGTVVDLLDDLFGDSPAALAGRAGSLHVACCGPEGMMAAASRWSAARNVRCDVSLEAPMACGIGICFTCVAKVRDASGGWDYRRTCIEGPVFDSSLIDW
jgi:dihydroorotate dehydrogenase electron transfer subunit